MQRGGLFAQMNKSDIISLAEPIPPTAKLQDVKKRKEKLPLVKIVTPSTNTIKNEYESLVSPSLSESILFIRQTAPLGPNKPGLGEGEALRLSLGAVCFST